MSEQSLDLLINEVSATQTLIEVLENQIKKNIFDKVREIVPIKFKDFNFKCILACGYTPGFNDGDPCEHTFNINYGKRTNYTKGDNSPITFFDFDYFDDFDSLFMEEGVNHNDIEAENIDIIPLVSDEEGKMITSFFESINSICEQADITDFQIIVFKKKDGEIIVEIDEEYDAGH